MLQPLDKPTALQSTYAEPDALARAGFGPAPLPGELRRRLPRRPPAALGILCLATDAAMLSGAIAIELTRTSGPQLGWACAFAALTLVGFGARQAYAQRPGVHLLDELAEVIAVAASAGMAVISLQVLLGTGDVGQTAAFWLFAT